jgi:trans-2,3-dihydro-3-hydroxyanthranilate isomerase
LGTYFVLKKKGLLKGPGIQSTEGGSTACHEDDQGWVWIVPPQGHVRDVLVSATRLASALGVGDVYLNDMMPPAVCGTGLDQLIVVSTNPAILSDLRPLVSRIASLEKDIAVEGIYVVAAVGPTTYQARYFNQEGEDPATGSAAAALGTYLMHSAGETAIRRYIITQGTEMGRSSEIHLRLNNLSLGSLELGGRVFPVIDGTFFV